MKPVSAYQSELYSAQHLFKSALPSNIAMMTGAALVCAYFYDDTTRWLGIWLGIMCLIGGLRIFLTQRFFIDLKNDFKQRHIRQWKQLYIFLTFNYGITSASLLFFLPQGMSQIDISIIYVVLFSTMAGSIATLPILLPAFFAFIIPLFIGTFCYALIMPSGISTYLGMMSVIYFGFISAAGKLMHRRYQQNIELMVENEKLIDKLHEEILQKELIQQALEENHLKLEDTVERRTKELADINEILIDEINERKRIEHNLKHMAHHDALTNLPNRLLLDARLNHAIERAKRSNLQVAVMFIDLDHFKTINDSLGHDIGDKLLISISKRLLHCVREDDTVARLGGDEFIIIIEQVHDIGDLDPLLKKIMRVTSDTVSISNHDLTTSASIGVSIFPDDGHNAEQLMRNADSAMYHVKENGRRKYHFYTRELTATAYDRVILETDLKDALKKNQLVVYYQPQISLHTRQIVGAEALVRWQHPELGILPPQQFLYIAEHSGLINDIGETVLATACQQMVRWKERNLPIDTVAVNIAGDQIHHGNLVQTVQDVLQDTGCKTSWLELEITEDFIIKKTKQSISTLCELRELGLSLAIDDFGTGYSSLSYLKQLPINKLKIDRSFIKDINNDMEDAALVQAIIAMGKSLNLKLIAEGVENSSHEIFLSAHGCELAQGFYYARPVTADELDKMLVEQQDKVQPFSNTG